MAKKEIDQTFPDQMNGIEEKRRSFPGFPYPIHATRDVPPFRFRSRQVVLENKLSFIHFPFAHYCAGSRYRLL